MKVNVSVKKLNELAVIPTQGSTFSAGYDLYAATDKPIILSPGATVKIETGLSFELPEGTFAAIFARSGIATKRGLRPANCTGVIDSDYRGNVMVAIHNDTGSLQTIEPQERIAQMILLPFIEMNFNEIKILNETDRGSGGFGSSGKK